MTLPTIQAGKTYVVLTTAPFDYSSGGRMRMRGISFVADMADQNATFLSIGMSRGHIVEVFDSATGATIVAKTAEKAYTVANNNAFIASASDGHIAAQQGVATAALAASLVAGLTGDIIVAPVLGDQLEVTGTVGISGKYRALLNGVIDGTVFTVAPATAPIAYSHTFVGNPAAGDVVGIQAMLADGVTTASDPVNVTVGANDVVLSSVIAGDTVVTFSIVRAGTYQAQISSVDSGAAAAKTAGSGRTLIFGAPPVGGDIVGVYESTAPITEKVTTTTKFKAPAITTPVIDADTTVVVTSSPAAANGTAVNVYRSGVSIGSGVVAGGAGSCTVTVSAIAVGDSLTAKHGAGASLSAASTAIIVAFDPPVITPVPHDTDTSVSGTSTAANGTPINVYRSAVSIGSTTVSGGTWTATTLALVTGDSLTAKAGIGATLSPASSPATIVLA